MLCLSKPDIERYDQSSAGDPWRSSVDEHLSGCDACRSALEQHRFRSAATLAGATISSPGGAGSVRIGLRGTASTKVPVIEGYTIQGVLGQGGMGIVYRALQTKLNRAVALKVLPSMVGAANPAAVQRFVREATAAARLHHTNIIPIYDFGESDDAYYYAMELVTGEPMNDFIERVVGRGFNHPSAAQVAEHLPEFTLAGTTANISFDASSTEPGVGGGSSGGAVFRGYFRQAARWIADASDAIHYAHGQGIIHRDIKPANLILSNDGRIMVADFGLAKSADDRSVTKTGALLGTLRYLSPEQAMARRVNVDHRTDVYSLGATLYELLSFRPAVTGKDEKEILSAVISRDPVPPKRVNSHVPAELSTICMKCLEKSPDARYATAKALADDLRRYINDLPIAARPPNVIQRAVKFVRRHKAPTAAVSAGVIVLALAVFLQRENVARRAAQVANRNAQIARLQESATSFVLMNRWAIAEDELRKALELDPARPETLLNLAWVKLEHYRSRPEEAGVKSQEAVVEACGKALALDPKNVRALQFQGIAQRRLKRYDEAIETLKRALEIEPDAFASWSNLGTMYVLKGDLSQADECMRKGTELAGTERDKWRAAVWRNRATLALIQRDEAAQEHVAQAISCLPTDVLSWIVRARIGLLSGGKHSVKEALDDAKHADRLAEFKDPQAKRIRATAHLLNGEFGEAAEQATLALQLGDPPTANLLILAGAAAGQGFHAEARERLAEAEEAWPAELRAPGGYLAEAGSGDLRVDLADETRILLTQARALAGMEDQTRGRP